MVWGRTSDRGEQRDRGAALTAAYHGPAGLPAPRNSQIHGHWKSAPTGSRGGAPIWTVRQAYMPEPTMKVLDAARERFWGKVEKSEKCWLWTGATTDKGYGLFWLNGRAEKAHRVAWMLKHGPLDEEIDVLHTCDVPACVNNEAHLWLGTHSDNMADMYAKGRRDHRKIAGEKNGGAKLTGAQVVEIKTQLAAGMTQRGLARNYDVDHATIGRIAHGTSWRDA